MRIHPKNSALIAPGVSPKDAISVLFFVTIQHRLLTTYPALILTGFEIKDVNRCAHAYTGKKNPNFCAGNFTGPKKKSLYCICIAN